MSDNIREEVVEKYLREQTLVLGGDCYKFTSPGRRGVVDRILVFDRGIVVWCEVKRPKGGVVASAQAREHARLRARGHWVEVCHTKGAVDRVMDAVRPLLK